MYKLKDLQLLVYLLMPVLISAQNTIFNWGNTHGHKEWDISSVIKEIKPGTICYSSIISEEISDSILGDHFNKNCQLTCLDSNGNNLWSKMIKGPKSEFVTSLDNDSTGFLISGLFQDTIYLDSSMLTSSNYLTPFIGKFNYDGNLIWLKKIEENLNANSFYLSSNHANIFCCGVYYNNQNYFENSIIKLYNINNNEVNCIKNIRTGYSTVISSMICTDSTIIITGNFADSLCFEDTTIKTNANKAFVLSIKLNGETDWFKTINSVGSCEIKCSNFLSSHKKITIAGSFSNSISIDSVQIAAQGDLDNFVAFLDQKGNLKWLKSFGGLYNDHLYSIASSSTLIYFSGTFKNSIQPSNNLYIESDSPYGSAFICSIDLNGQCQAFFKLPTTAEDIVTDINITQNDILTCIGTYTDTLFIPYTTSGLNKVLISNGDKDIFILNFDNICKGFNVQLADSIILCPSDTLVLSVSDVYSNYIWEKSIIKEDLPVCEPGYYELLVIDDKGCIAQDSINVISNFPSTIVCEQDIFALPGEDINLNNSTATYVDSLYWTTSGNGYFNTPNSLNTIYSPSVLDLSKGFVTLYLNGHNSCGNTQDSLLITFQIDEDLITVFPNPTSGYVSLVANEGIEIENISITNQLGYVILQQQVNNYFFNFDLSQQLSGTYLIFLETNSGFISKTVNKL